MRRPHKAAIITLAVLLAFVLLIAGLRSYGGRRAVEWFEERYGLRVMPGVVTVQSVGTPKLFQKSWPAQLEYQDVEFRVDILNRSDDFAYNYVKASYLNKISDAYPDENIRSFNIPHVTLPLEGLPNIMPLDYLFWLEVVFADAVDSKEAFAKGAEDLMQAMDRAGLTNCDTVLAYATVGGQQMELIFHPIWHPSYQELYDLIGDLPMPEMLPAFP